MITKYYAATYLRDMISKVEVQGETEEFVINQYKRRELKISDKTGYFDTWEEAYKWLEGKFNAEIRIHEKKNRKHEEETRGVG
jgi:hypothetical protein